MYMLFYIFPYIYLHFQSNYNYNNNEIHKNRYWHFSDGNCEGQFLFCQLDWIKNHPRGEKNHPRDPSLGISMKEFL